MNAPPPLPDKAPQPTGPYVPCPQCQSPNVTLMSFTWWGGLLGPKLLTHCKCGSCGATFNGKTGKSNTVAIIIYSVVIVAIIGAVLLAVNS